MQTPNCSLRHQAIEQRGDLRLNGVTEVAAFELFVKPVHGAVDVVFAQVIDTRCVNTFNNSVGVHVVCERAKLIEVGHRFGLYV